MKKKSHMIIDRPESQFSKFDHLPANQLFLMASGSPIFGS